MFEFIRIQYRMGRLTAQQVSACVPRWLTAAQAARILEDCVCRF